MRSHGGTGLQTVERALAVLSLFSAEIAQFSIAEVARHLDIPRSGAVRLLRTLESGRFLERQSGKYRLGPALLELGALYKKCNPVLTVADGILRELVSQTGHTAYFGSVDSGDAVILAKHEGTRPVRFVWEVGDRLPVATTAFGKAILMTLPEDELARHFGDDTLTPLTTRSITNREALEVDLFAARERGWATATEESYPGICAIAAPVFGASPASRYGLSLSFLHLSEAERPFDKLAPVVLEGAERLSAHLRGFEALNAGGRDRAIS